MPARFYIEPEDAGKDMVLLSERESRHAATVLRLRRGDAVVLFDGEGRAFKGVVAGIRDRRLAVSVKTEVTETSAARYEISVAISVIRPERMEWLIEKACELGVSGFFPLVTDRCIVKLSRERWASKWQRWRKIAVASCKQCGIARIPQIHATQSFEDFFSLAAHFNRILIPTLAAKGVALYAALRHSHHGKILALIGPEGDFTKREVELARGKGATPVDLGPIVMRSETAAVYILSAVNFYFREICDE